MANNLKKAVAKFRHGTGQWGEAAITADLKAVDCQKKELERGATEGFNAARTTGPEASEGISI